MLSAKSPVFLNVFFISKITLSLFPVSVFYLKTFFHRSSVISLSIPGCMATNKWTDVTSRDPESVMLLHGAKERGEGCDRFGGQVVR